jgi:penicillin amidase
MRKSVKRVFLAAGLTAAAVLLLACGGFLWLVAELRASLPLLDGELKIAGLEAEVVIERDEIGIPTIRAANRLDLARATGFLHAQERFFQMDLMRRQAAGELAALVGEPAVELDRANRLHRFRARADAASQRLSGRHREIIEAYTAGINAGLQALGSAPPEYLALRAEPAPWHDEDSMLVLMSMYLLLQGGSGWRESYLGMMSDLLPPELFEFLTPGGTEWDAPLTGGPLPEPAMPGSASINLRTVDFIRSSSFGAVPQESLAGSNSWAVAGWRTANGEALLANDIHLPLSMPNIWYRCSFEWTEESTAMRTAGITLPGAPALISGSNGRLAWGYTTSPGDVSDLVVIETDPEDGDRYLTPDGYRPFERHLETIEVKGGEEVEYEVRSTIWGPVIDSDYRGRQRALRWVAHDPEAADMDLLELESAESLEEAIAISQRCGIPMQNIVFADDGGRIGWTLIGMLPRRVGHDGRLPSSWADGSRRWEGWLEPAEYPAVIDPESGLIWSANNRIVDGEWLERVGDGGYDLGARAGQIRDDLLALEEATVGEMLAIQLDDRALFLERWRELLLSCLTDDAIAGDARRGSLRQLIEENWTGSASVDSSAYRMVRAFRLLLAERVFDAILAPWIDEEGRSRYLRVAQWEGPLWRLVSEKPPHLLDPRFDSWDEQLLEAVDALFEFFSIEQGSDLAEKTWGQRNTVRITHPLSRAVPQLARWLDIDPMALPGDSNMPRVQSPSFGASDRMVVSPGLEEEGILHMPGGQSGHFLSPFYRKGHEDWVEGRPAPLLPGLPAHILTLLPQ